MATKCGGPCVKGPRPQRVDYKEGKDGKLVRIDTYRCTKKVKGVRCQAIIYETKKL